MNWTVFSTVFACFLLAPVVIGAGVFGAVWAADRLTEKYGDDVVVAGARIATWILFAAFVAWMAAT